MSFSCKIVLSHYEKRDGMKAVYLEAIMDRLPARVPLGFYLDEAYLDARTNQVKANHPNAETYNTEFQLAITNANQIASRFRIQKKKLTPSLFRAEYINPSDELDLIRYMRKELTLRTPELQPNTVKQHNTVINTFASMMVEGGHLAETQKMMGHGNIKTTMGYVHTSTKNLVDAKNKRFESPV